MSMMINDLVERVHEETEYEVSYMQSGYFITFWITNKWNNYKKRVQSLGQFHEWCESVGVGIEYET